MKLRSTKAKRWGWRIEKKRWFRWRSFDDEVYETEEEAERVIAVLKKYYY